MRRALQRGREQRGASYTFRSQHCDLQNPQNCPIRGLEGSRPPPRLTAYSGGGDVWGREATLTATAGRSGQHGPPCHPTPSVLLLSTVTGGPEPQQRVLPPTHDPVTSVLSVSLSPRKHEHIKLLGRQPAASLAVSLGGVGGAGAGHRWGPRGQHSDCHRTPHRGHAPALPAGRTGLALRLLEVDGAGSYGRGGSARGGGAWG